MLHERHYTLEQASAVMGWVTERIGWIRDAHRQLVALGPEAGEAVAGLNETTGGSYPGRSVARPLVELSRAVGELEAVDIVVRDFERGLVDFPALRSRMTGVAGVQARLDAERSPDASEEVYLCWLVDEEQEIGFWHAPEAGFSGRRAL
jgi:Uncharacterized conserved protein (DUF2203)